MRECKEGDRVVYLCSTCGHGDVCGVVSDGTVPQFSFCSVRGCGRRSYYFDVLTSSMAEVVKGVASEWYRPGSLAGIRGAQATILAQGGLLRRAFSR